MTKDNWVQILVGTIILGTLAFVAVKIVDITGTLGSVEAKVTSTSERVDRIAQVLPDVGVRIAQEEIARPLKTIVVASTPYQVNGGRYVRTLTVVDATAQVKWTTPIALASRDDRELVGALAWAGADMDREFSSFSEMQRYSRAARSSTELPAYLDARASFVLRSVAADEYIEQMNRLGLHPRRAMIHAAIESWPTLVVALKEREEIFKPAPPHK